MFRVHVCNISIIDIVNMRQIVHLGLSLLYMTAVFALAFWFLPVRRSVRAGINCRGVSVCLSHAGIVKTAKRRIMQKTSGNSPVSDSNSRWWVTPFPLKFAFKVTHPTFEHNDFDQYMLARKVQLPLTESRQCAFYRDIDEPSELPLSPPKGGSKREFLHLPLTFISLLQVIEIEIKYMG